MKYYENGRELSRGLCIALGIFIIIGMVIPVSADATLSPGLSVLSKDFTMAVDGLCGTEVRITKKDFADGLGTENVGKITVVSLPDSSLGRLQLGEKYVEVGETVSERNLDSLKFVPWGSGEISASFEFCRGGSVRGVVYTCNIYTTKKVNTAPEFDAAQVSAAADAYSGVAHLGTLKAHDADGDEMTFEVITAPSNGKVKLTDKNRGYFEYTSNEGFVGRDSFTVAVTDKYGNRSANAKIMLDVVLANADEVYTDMKGHYANGAVISCVRLGIIDKAAEGVSYNPDEAMSRAEFLALAMKAAGYKGLGAANTGFADDGEIPAEYKGYIAAARAFGFVSGIETEAGVKFCPNNQITRLEACVMLSRITGIEGDGSLTVFADEAAVPTWAASAVSGMQAAGVIRGNASGKLELYSPITRGAAAQMVYAGNYLV